MAKPQSDYINGNLVFQDSFFLQNLFDKSVFCGRMKPIKNMKKTRFDLNKALFISSVLILCLTLLVFAFLNHFIFKQIQKQLFDQYRENTELSISSCAQNLSFYFRSNYAKLDFIANEGKFSSATEQEIIKSIKSANVVIEPDYEEIVFINSRGEAFGANGKKNRIFNGKFIKQSEKFHQEYFVTDPEFIKSKNKSLFFVGRPLTDQNQNYKGILGFSIEPQKVKDFLMKINLPENFEIGIIDSQGNLIIHSDLENPQNINLIEKEPKYEKFTSNFFAKTKSGFIQTQGKNKEIVDLIYRPLEGTSWILGISIPHTKIAELNFLKEKTYWILLIVIFGLVLLLLIVETSIFSYFQKRKSIAGNYDSLTNLWTRQKFEEEASIILKHNKNSVFLLVNADIRGFKFINQNFGNQTADKLLYYFSELLNIYVKKHKGILSRGYADRFYSLIKVENKEQTLQTFSKYLDEMNKNIKAYDIPFTPKFGLSFYSTEALGTSIQNLIGEASFARSTIKDDAMHQYAVYDSKLLKTINEEQYMEQHMQEGLETGQFFIMYQPKIDLKTEKIVGAEALVRWQEPKMGLLPPAKFIPLFEKNGFVKKLDFYVYEKVFQFVQKQLSTSQPIVPISVNMSRIHTNPKTFINEFMKVFNKYDVNSNYIEVEILERSIIEDDTLLEITNLLHNNGFRVAMDDFGAGESSLNMLTRIPVDILKFDREFLLNSTNENGELNKKDAVFIQTLVNLSKNLNKQTIFEGVETKVQRDFLKKINCDQVQGYFYSKPLTESDFLKFLKEHL